MIDRRVGDVSLRALLPRDAAVFASWALDRDFCSIADWTAGLPFADYEQFHRGLVTDPPSDLIRRGVVCGEELVGYVDLHGCEADRRELGFLIGPAYFGQGLGTAAARLALEVAFGDLGMHEVWAEAADANIASVRILARIGMRETGRGSATEYRGQPTSTGSSRSAQRTDERRVGGRW